MSTVGLNTPFPKVSSTCFIVKNMAPGNKRIRIFGYPILNGGTRDLLAIPYISEADIRHSLLKGELAVRLRNREIMVVQSDIDLLQFNDDQYDFLTQAGITKGLHIEPTDMKFKYVTEVVLVGIKNASNKIFTIPSGHFLFNDDYKINVYENGVRQTIDDNYTVVESGGVGTGYDIIVMVDAPFEDDILVADYYLA